MKTIPNFGAAKNAYTKAYFFYLKRRFHLIGIIKLWLIRYKIHILIWAVYIFYEIAIEWLSLNSLSTPVDYITHYTFDIALFYVHADLVVPYVLQRKYFAVWKLCLAILLEFAVYTLICFADDKILFSLNLIKLSRPLHLDFVFCLRNLYVGTYFVAFSTGYYFLRTYIKEKHKNEEIEKQRLNEIILRQRAEQELTIAHNAFLKAQINPHFLFNTLDFIYYQVMEVSPKAADAIIALADMMRYAIDADKAGEFIPMGEEIDQVINLIYLNQIRKSGEIDFEFIYPNEVRELRFIPLVLLTLTENIFKHGNLTNQNKASLKIGMIDDMLTIESDNASGRTNSAKSTGNGLKNTETRLHYAYGDAATFTHHTNNEGRFKLKITVPVNLLADTASPSAISTGTGTI